MKTMSALHLKQCVQSFSVFDFLRDIMNKIPDLGGSDAAGDDRASKRRRTVDEGNDSDEDMKPARTQGSTGPSSGGGRGRGRGRGRGHGARSNRATERESAHLDKCEDDPDTSPQREERKHGIKSDTIPDNFNVTQPGETKAINTEDAASVRNFDLNLKLDENGDTTTATKQETKAPDEYPGWSDNMAQISIDPVQLALLNGRLDEEDEDYDYVDDLLDSVSRRFIC